MTGQLPPAEGRVYGGPPEQVAQGMPTGPRGSRGELHASQLMSIAALAAAHGMTQNAIDKFLREVQEVALSASLASAPRLIRHSRNIAQAKLNEVIAAVNALHRVPMVTQQTGWRSLLPQPMLPPDAPAYVSLQEVQRILAGALGTLIVED